MNLTLEPALYLVATPIGNLGDITERAVTVLRQVKLVAAEDTRHSKQLLRHLGSNAELFAAHQHNEQKVSQRIIAEIKAGNAVALISDAGMPAICDPGAILVQNVRAAGQKIIVLPGACAFITALAASGINCGQSNFYGFLPATSSHRLAKLQEISTSNQHDVAAIFYEAPHRIIATLKDFARVFGEEQQIFIGKEISKINETYLLSEIKDLLIWLSEDNNRQKGEFVIIIPLLNKNEKNNALSNSAQEFLQFLINEQQLSVRQAVAIARFSFNENQKLLYNCALQIKAT